MKSIDSFNKNWKTLLIENTEKIKGIGIGNGLSGCALFFFNDYKLTGNTKSLKHFCLLLEELIKRLHDISYHQLLVADITEMTYLLSISSKSIQNYYDVSELTRQMVDLIISLSKKQIINEQYDPFIGAFYPAYYFSCRHPKAYFLTPFFDLLFSRKKNQKELHFDSKFLTGKVCLSITHGLAFYIVLLCRTDYPFVAQKELYKTLKGYVEFVLKNKMNFEVYGCFFPDYVGERMKTRMSLCYGDLGIIYSLILASYKLKDLTLLNDCVKMLSKTLERKQPNETRIEDLSLLYGDAGIYLFLKKIKNLNKHLLPDKTIHAFWENRLKSGILKTDTDYLLSESFLVEEGINILTFSEGITGSLMCLSTNNWKDLQHLCFPFYLQ